MLSLRSGTALVPLIFTSSTQWTVVICLPYPHNLHILLIHSYKHSSFSNPLDGVVLFKLCWVSIKFDIQVRNSKKIRKTNKETVLNDKKIKSEVTTTLIYAHTNKHTRADIHTHNQCIASSILINYTKDNTEIRKNEKSNSQLLNTS